MTVNTTSITSGPYTGNNVTTSFSYNFKLQTKNDVEVYETNLSGNRTLLTVDTHYTVNNIGQATGGTITSSGTVLVGEQGPELLNLGRGASVIPLDKGSGQTIVYNAAPNNSLDSEQSLFLAMRRAKVVAGW